MSSSPLRRWSCAGALAALAALALACSSGGWQSRHLRDHVLVGKIWDATSGEFVGEASLQATLAARRFVLLGEKHDNPDHHRLQARLIDALARAGRRPVVAFEMLSADVAPELAALAANPQATPEEVRAAVRWDASGWPPFELYAVIFEVALRERLPLATANLPKRTLALVSRSGLEGLAERAREDLALVPPLTTAERAVMAAELRAAHCGHGDAARLERMVDVQSARDAWMAAALLTVESYPGTGGAVLVAGNEHVRRDRGVPRYVLLRDPDATIASVAFVEVRADATDPRAALGLAAGAAAPYDFVWFTPRSDDRDPCERFRRDLERIRESTPRDVD
jgi:uncharacterized iron-regulated protein